MECVHVSQVDKQGVITSLGFVAFLGLSYSIWLSNVTDLITCIGVTSESLVYTITLQSITG